MPTAATVLSKADRRSRIKNLTAGLITLTMIVWMAVLAAPDLIGSEPGRRAAPAARPIPGAALTQGRKSRLHGTHESILGDLSALLPGTVVVRPTEEGGSRHVWNSKTHSNNCVQTWDDDGDGVLDHVQVGVGLPEGNEPYILESLAIGHRVVCSASATGVDGPSFVQWTQDAMNVPRPAKMV